MSNDGIAALEHTMRRYWDYPSNLVRYKDHKWLSTLSSTILEFRELADAGDIFAETSSRPSGETSTDIFSEDRAEMVILEIDAHNQSSCIEFE